MAAPRRLFGVLGLGTFGSTVASELMRFGNHVIGADTDPAVVALHAERLSEALIVDARDDAALRQAGFAECDVCLVAMASQIEASILASMNLKLLGVGQVWAKAKTKTHHRILSRIGVDRVIHPEMEMGARVAQVMNNPLVRDYVSLGNGFHVVNFRVPESLEGRSLLAIRDIGRFELRCLGIMRGTEYVGREGDDCVLHSEDLMLLLGQRENLRAFADSL